MIQRVFVGKIRMASAHVHGKKTRNGKQSNNMTRNDLRMLCSCVVIIREMVTATQLRAPS